MLAIVTAYVATVVTTRMGYWEYGEPSAFIKNWTAQVNPLRSPALRSPALRYGSYAVSSASPAGFG